MRLLWEVGEGLVACWARAVAVGESFGARLGWEGDVPELYRGARASARATPSCARRRAARDDVGEGRDGREACREGEGSRGQRGGGSVVVVAAAGLGRVVGGGGRPGWLGWLGGGGGESE